MDFPVDGIIPGLKARLAASRAKSNLDKESQRRFTGNFFIAACLSILHAPGTRSAGRFAVIFRIFTGQNERRADGMRDSAKAQFSSVSFLMREGNLIGCFYTIRSETHVERGQD